MTCQVLLFVEDPGAANILAPLAVELRRRNATTQMLSAGLASEILKCRSVDFIDLNQFPSNSVEQIFSKFSPAVFVAGTAENAETIALPLFKEGQRLNIPTVGVVDMLVNAERRFRGTGAEALAYAPDYIVVPDEVVSSAYLRLGFPPENLMVVGYPHFDVVQQKASQYEGARGITGTSIPRIVFVAEPRSRLNPTLSRPNSNYTLHGSASSDFRTLIVMEEVIAGILEAEVNAHLIVRLHPKSEMSDFESYRNRVSEFSSGGDPLEVLLNADLVIGMTSMLLQEAAWMGVPTLAVLPEKSQVEMLAGIANGLIPSVSERTELVRLLKMFKAGNFVPQNPANFFKKGATSRLADFIYELSRQRESKGC